MTPYYADDHVQLHHGDCLDVLRELPDASVDAVVTDPPYALEFMGKTWDGWSTPAAFQEWCGLWAAECLRVLKPGGHILAFGGSRTWHRLAVAVEDAGFEIRDSIAWLYGQGFPKSFDVSKALDKAAGVERKVVGSKLGLPGRSAGQRQTSGFGDRAQIENHGEDPAKRAARGIGRTVSEGRTDLDITTPATPDAARWQGWGTSLKPAFEPIVVGRKPLAGTVVANVLTHGTGVLNIDGTRVPMSDHDRGVINSMGGYGAEGYTHTESPVYHTNQPGAELLVRTQARAHDAGRWPTNVVLDDTQSAELDRQSDSGDASRFFPTFRYEAKAATAERPRVGEVAHPTVKPLDLMRWLVRLVTPPGGVVLDPFAGSGTTAEACVLEGFRCIAIEREADYLPLIVSRLSKPLQLGLDLGEAS